MCVYSDSLDWVIDFSPHLGIARIMDPSNCIICSRYQKVRDCVSILSKHTQAKLEGPEIDFDRPPSSWSPGHESPFLYVLYCMTESYSFFTPGCLPKAYLNFITNKA